MQNQEDAPPSHVRVDHGAQRLVLQVLQLRHDVGVCVGQSTVGGLQSFVAVDSVSLQSESTVDSQWFCPAFAGRQGGRREPALSFFAHLSTLMRPSSVRPSHEPSCCRSAYTPAQEHLP